MTIMENLESFIEEIWEEIESLRSEISDLREIIAKQDADRLQ